MGGPKGGVLLAGEPLVRHAWRILAPFVGGPLDAVVVSGRPGTPRPAPGVERVGDRVPGLGPAGGLEAGLLRARERGCGGVFLLACDLPLVPTAWVERLVREAGVEGPTLPASGGPLGFEPLCGVYPVGLLPRIQEFLRTAGEGRERSMGALVRGLPRVKLVEPPGGRDHPDGRFPDAFLNVNRPGELATAEQRMAEGDWRR